MIVYVNLFFYMKIKLILVLFIGLYPAIIYSQAKDYSSINSYLEKLDQYIKDKPEYDRKKDERIQSLLDKLSRRNLPLDEKYGLTYLLFEEYSTYSYDSMFIYSQKLIDISRQMSNKDKLVKSQVCLAYSHLWGGLFKDAYEYSQSIDITGISEETRIDYLMFLFNLNFECGLYAKYDRYLFNVYEKKMLDLIDELELLLPPDDERLLEIKQKECFHSDKFQEAYNYSQERFAYKDESRRQTAIKLGDAGFICLEIGDTINAVKYMVEASIIDIEQGTHQAPSLRRLAETLYPLKDLKGAYKYIQLAMENARFFGSRYRMYEASIILPTIDKELYDLTNKQKSDLTLAIISIGLLFVIILISIIIIVRQNRKLKISRLRIEEQNQSLLKINSEIKYMNKELLEANTIKETYLGQILSDNSSYITKIEDLAKNITRKVKTKQYDGILYDIDKSNYQRERDKMLISFDKMFLMLYPDFIEKFNSLLKEEDKISVSDKYILTPELRIFALIRLGVTKNDTIAEILDYSVSTVKNYKTRIRNISVVPNDEFERKLMEIESARIE